MGRRRHSGRDISGILLVDKPIGISSNDTLQRVKRLYHARKAGHTGSLDKLADGLLPICLGEATKISGFLLNANKHYLSTFKLGVTTTTGDAEGEELKHRPVMDLEPARIGEVLERFTGPIEQIPPMHSAIKHQGQPLYKLAHQGIEIERKPRTVTIHALELLAFQGDELRVEVRCSKGTYIRTLAEDIGETLGCGAHVSALRRIGSGPYDGGSVMHTLEQLEKTEALDALLLPIESALEEWPALELSADMRFYIRQGQPVMVPRAPTSGWVRLYGNGDIFLGVGEVQDDGRIAPRRLLNPKRTG